MHRQYETQPQKRSPSPPKNTVRPLRLIGWNALWLAAALMLLAIAGEVGLRWKQPFYNSVPFHFHPGAGRILAPDSEVHWTNGLDFWTKSRVNSLGFLDREPVSPQRAAKSCHITLIGDSFVEAREVSIDDKFQVRLEMLAASELPRLDITTSAFGAHDTGQVNQLGFYDEFARHLHPKLVVLVFVSNDFSDNSTALRVIYRGWDLDQLRWLSAVREPKGTLALQLPAPDYSAVASPQESSPYSHFPLMQWVSRAGKAISSQSFFATWLDHKIRLFFMDSGPELTPSHSELAQQLRQDPRYGYGPLLDGWTAPNRRGGAIYSGQVADALRSSTPEFQEDLHPFYQSLPDSTAFALDQFKERAERDGAALIILASYIMKAEYNSVPYDLMQKMAMARDIPVVDQYDYILRQGGDPDRDARWEHDNHWNVAGHQWAAEALLEYLKANQAVCGTELQ